VFIVELVFSGLLPAVRFSLGFYAGRVFSIITSSIVLIVMLAETTRLYMGLARSNAMLRREQDNKLMNLEAMAASISHEIRQPIAAMTANSTAAIRLIEREPLDRSDRLGGHGRLDAVVQLFRLAGSRFRKQDRELVAADAAGDIGRTQRRAKACACLGEDGVAGEVADALVDRLEVVYVQGEEREAAAVTVRAGALAK